mgnify:CR=1 FL=1|jgi:molybdopterin synthase catalytic subunit|tara:strand:- start:426 stop:611 length:186 start_codon:yes stop_codon:yes gene_type:complete
MAKQLELKFEAESELISKIKKEIPDFKKNGFQTEEEWKKAKEYDRAYRHMKQLEGARKCDT